MVSIFVNVAGRFGLNTREAERFFKFAVVGVIGFIVDFGVSNLLLNPFAYLLREGTQLNELVSLYSTKPQAQAIVFAGTISFVCAIISNFTWNRYWTYPDSRSKSFRRQFVQFVLVSMAGIIIRTPILAATTGFFVHSIERIPSLANLALRIGANIALALAVVIVMFWNFFVNRYWTYNDVDS